MDRVLPKAMLIRCQRRHCFGNAFHLYSAKGLPQLAFGVFQDPLLSFRQIFSSAVDVKIQHRHRRLIGRAFSSFAPLGRTFQRQRNAMLCFVTWADHLRAFDDFFASYSSIHRVVERALRLPARQLRRLNVEFRVVSRTRDNQSARPMRVALTNSSV